MSKKYGNLAVATGHAMIGLSLGPATGKLICEMLTGNAASVDIKPYEVERFE
jgi:D-amino-acid dehydrogenase